MRLGADQDAIPGGELSLQLGGDRRHVGATALPHAGFELWTFPAERRESGTPPAERAFERRVCAFRRRDRSLSRGGPAGLAQLLDLAFHLRGPVGRALRLDDEHVRLGRQQLSEHRGTLEQDLEVGLHPFEGDPVGESVQLAREVRVAVERGDRATAHVVGQEQLTARERGQGLHRAQRALARHGEGPQRIDLVPEQLDAHGVVVGRREHIEEEAAHGELSARGDHVGPSVAGDREPVGELVQRNLVAPARDDRVEPVRAGDHVLDDRTDRRDDDPRRVLRAQPVKGLEPPGDRLGAGRQLLVREGLPRREEHGVGCPRLDLRCETLGVARAGQHDQPRARLPVGQRRN